MWQRELKAAISGQQPIIIRLKDGDVMHGVPESCTDRVKLRNNDGMIWVPIADIEHVGRLIPFQPKKDPTSI